MSEMPMAPDDRPMELMKRFRLQSAHRLPNVPASDPESRLHGHTFGVEIYVRGPVDPHLGWVIDFAEIKEAFAEVFSALDHHPLNEVEGLSDPTPEKLAAWIYQRLEGRLRYLHRVVVEHGVGGERAVAGER